MTETTSDVLRHADVAQDSIRALNRVAPAILPAPTAVDLLDQLSALTRCLPESFTAISTGLIAAQGLAFEDDDGESAPRTAQAIDALARAWTIATKLTEELQLARDSIERQRYLYPPLAG